MMGASEGPWTQFRPAQRWGMLALLFLVSLSAYADRQVLSVLIEPIKHEFGVSDTEMGLLGGLAFAVFYATLGLPIARVADRGSRKLVITLSLITWSVMTVACGLAPTFLLLFLARVGVGAGEAGALPPAQSLIADYFPPEQRARALSVFLLSATLGYIVAFSGGAMIAAAHGWRAAFIALAVPGVLIALLAGIFLREPQRPPSATGGEPLRATLAVLWGKRSYVLLCVAMILYWMVAYGALTWLPAYQSRVLGMDLAKIGAAYGTLTAVGTLVGSLLGGWVTDKVNARGARNAARLPSIVLIASTPLFWLAVANDSEVLFFAASFVGGLALSVSVPALFTVLHMVCGSPRRAIAVAIALFFANLVGLGVGPVLTGALSDALSAQMGPVGLRYALMASFSLLIPAGASLFLASNSVERDLEA